VRDAIATKCLGLGLNYLMPNSERMVRYSHFPHLRVLYQWTREGTVLWHNNKFTLVTALPHVEYQFETKVLDSVTQ
jgi:hypothetical protein